MTTSFITIAGNVLNPSSFDLVLMHTNWRPKMNVTLDRNSRYNASLSFNCLQYQEYGYSYIYYTHKYTMLLHVYKQFATAFTMHSVAYNGRSCIGHFQAL